MYGLFKPGIYNRGISPDAYMLLFTHIACLPPGTVVYNWLVHYSAQTPKLVRAQTYHDGVFLVWQEIIRRILDIPLCKYPLGNKNPHIEEQSYINIYVKISFDYKHFPTRNICIQSTFSKTDTFGTGTKCPSQRDVCLIKSQIKGISKSRDQLQVSVLQRCPSYRGVR